jgi:uncharacterized phiE125 gp8 family phage protein
MKYKVTTPISTEPISLEEARAHLRIEAFGSPLEHPDDAYVTALISVARSWCEQYTQRALATQTIELVADDFMKSLALPFAPIQSVSSVEYIDTDGATQTLATSVYALDEYANEIKLKYNQQYPATQAINNAVTVTYIAGYTNGESPDSYPLPASIKAAMLLIIGHLYENRQENTSVNMNSLPMGVMLLLTPYRLGLGL